jgi:hypothetical protein
MPHCQTGGCHQGRAECPTPTACGSIVVNAAPPQARDTGFSGSYRRRARIDRKRALHTALAIAMAICIAGAAGNYLGIF